MKALRGEGIDLLVQSIQTHLTRPPSPFFSSSPLERKCCYSSSITWMPNELAFPPSWLNSVADPRRAVAQNYAVVVKKKIIFEITQKKNGCGNARVNFVSLIHLGFPFVGLFAGLHARRLLNEADVILPTVASPLLQTQRTHPLLCKRYQGACFAHIRVCAYLRHFANLSQSSWAFPLSTFTCRRFPFKFILLSYS